MKVIYTEEAAADIAEALAYVNERNPTASAKLDAELTRCVERLADREFEGPVSRLRSGAVVRSWGVPPFRIYYQRSLPNGPAMRRRCGVCSSAGSTGVSA